MKEDWLRPALKLKTAREINNPIKSNPSTTLAAHFQQNKAPGNTTNAACHEIKFGKACESIFE